MQGPLHFVFLIGCTGCGKGAVGLELARTLGGEIVSCDSMKVYRRLDIGTAKPSGGARASVPHHLIDVAEPWEDFSVARFVPAAEAAGREIAGRGAMILVVGGTALYIKALSEGLFEGPSADVELRESLRRRAAEEGSAALHAELTRVDPAAAERIHRNDLRRIVRALEIFQLTGQPISSLQKQWDRDRTKHRCTFVGLRRSLEDQNRRTNARVRRLIELGWVEEVRRLLDEPRPMSTSAGQALGYREIIEHVGGKLSLEEAGEKIKIATRQFAKAQRTWFKRFREVHWFDVGPEEPAGEVATRIVDELEPTCLK